MCRNLHVSAQLWCAESFRFLHIRRNRVQQSIFLLLASCTQQQVVKPGGASPANVVGRVVGDGLKLTAIGVLAGAAGALALSRLLATFLFGVRASDPATYAVVAFVLLATATVASYMPARRAMQVDPMTALREE